MKKILALIIFSACFAPMLLMAQTEDSARKISEGATLSDSIAEIPPAAECSLPQEHMPRPYSRHTYFGRDAAGETHADSLHLPVLDLRGSVPLMSVPYEGWWGMDTWRLHQGLNMNVGASVFASFGKGAPKGAGFGQDVSLMYAMPLTGKLSFAVGGWLSNAYWAHDRYTDAGLSAVLGYKFDEHWEAYVYGRKSVMNKPVPYRFRSMQELGDRIGASVKYNFSPSFSVQVSVSAGKYDLPEPADFSAGH